MERSIAGKSNKPDQQSATRARPTPLTGGRRAPALQLRPNPGNLVLGRLIQAKLTIGASGDQYEQEADHVAEQVTRMPDARESGAEVAAHSGPLQIQRACSECEEELQRQTDDQVKDSESNLTRGQPKAASPSTESSVNSLRAGGEPLPPSVRARFEPRFGHDFGQVRVHTGLDAARSAGEMNALAFTVGRDIALADGEYSPETHAGQRLLAHELTHVVQQGYSGSASPGVVQRQVAPEHDTMPGEQPDRQAPPPRGVQGALIVEDDSQQIGPGQMRKTEFLSRLRSDVCRESEEGMKGTGRTTDGCPYVEKWFGYYADKDSTYIERSLRKYAPEAGGATSASDYIPLVAARVRRSVEVWAQTGEITGVPDELAGAVMGGGILGAIGTVASTIGRAIGSVVSGIGSVISGIGRLFFKGQGGGPSALGDPSVVGGMMSGGSSLDGQVRQRMETAFGHDFSGVRIHTDSEAGGLSARMNARAFTIGQQIAFGPGEYQPGTMIGDALIAHELAHVAQQSSAGAGEAILQKGGEGANALEEDADMSAVKAVVSMWSGKNARLTGVAERAMPSLRSGLRLQRCGGPSVPGPNFNKDCSVPEKSALTQAYSLAQRWVGITLAKVDGLLAGQPDSATLNQLDNHFHIKDVAQSREDVMRVRKGFAKLQEAFAGPVPFQCEKEQGGGGEGGCLEGGGERIANVPGLFWMRFDIHVYPDFFRDVVVPYSDVLKPEELKAGAPKERAAIIIHEMAHKFLRVDDIEYYKGCHTRQYNALSTKQALDNADSYAQFARYIQADK